MMELFTKIVNNFNPFPANINVLYLLETRKDLCFLGIFRTYKMETSARGELKGFDGVGNVGLSHKNIDL